MRRFHLVIAITTTALLVAGAAFAADLKIPPRLTPQNFSMQKGPPNCSRWTDDCVNCSRAANGESPVCSNIGFACQPKAIRCLGPDKPQK